MQVTEVWCTNLHCSRGTVGKAVADFLKYVTGTSFITKHTVMRHLESKVHHMGVEFDKLAETPLGQVLKTGQKRLGDESYPRQGPVASKTSHLYTAKN